jgi:hypothetical protein
MDQQNDIDAGSITPPGTPRPDMVQVDRVIYNRLMIQSLENQRIRHLMEIRRQQRQNFVQRRNIVIPPFNLN